MTETTALTLSLLTNIVLTYFLLAGWRIITIFTDRHTENTKEIEHLRHCLELSEANQIESQDLDGMCQALCEGGLPALRGWLLTHPAPTPPEDQA